jgi:nucleotide-binding universal stress UspA family protein
MYERILLALDGSKVGEAAIPVIEELLTKMKPELKIEVNLVAVVTTTTYWVVAGEASAPVQYTEKELDLIKNRIRAYLERTGEGLRSRGAVVNTIIKVGNAAAEIVKTAEEVGADLIAMSTHGRSGLSRLAFGSVTDKVIHQAQVPVIMVRAPEGTKNA